MKVHQNEQGYVIVQDSSDWVPASGGTETPFFARSGARLLYVWQPSTGSHAYLNVETDMILSEEESRFHLGTY